MRVVFGVIFVLSCLASIISGVTGAALVFAGQWPFGVLLIGATAGLLVLASRTLKRLVPPGTDGVPGLAGVEAPPPAPAAASIGERLSAWAANVRTEGEWGPLNPALICPHCQEKGSVRTKPVDRKAGISGAKVAGAVLLGPISLLATGLSRRETVTQAHCGNCSSTWQF